MVLDIQREKAKCPICTKEFEYVKGGYTPHTCSNFDCIYAYFHKKYTRRTEDNAEKPTNPGNHVH